MNKQGQRKIDWTDYTWNPISGCKHGCEYCYMLRMESRFPGTMKPAFHSKRLSQPLGVKKPSLVFTGSSGDMWGDWVDSEWIDDVLDVCSALAPHHTYQFLTKNPHRYGQFAIPKNCWVGTTVDGTERTKNNIDDLVIATNGHCNIVRFISFEPLLSKVCPDLYGIRWVIIGANSNKGAARPPKQWADIIIEAAWDLNIPVWVKDNYGYPERIKEMPSNHWLMSDA